MPADYLLLIVVGGLILGGAVLTKFFLRMPARDIFIGIPGLIIGLIIGSLLSLPFQNLPGLFGLWVPITITLISVFVSIYVFYKRRGFVEKFTWDLVKNWIPTKSAKQNENLILVDTSAVIDGRFLSIINSGFLIGKIIIYRFVLEELQKIADSGDDLKREKGRRGLELLGNIEEEKGEIEILDEDIKDVKGVDAKLLKAAKQKKAAIMTVDYNLNKMARIQKIKVLNVNELSEAIKPVVIPGEELRVRIVQQGKEKHQGVAYLNDGTMIVVESGEKYVGKEKDVVISRIIQTPAGRLYFSKIKNGKNNKRS